MKQHLPPAAQEKVADLEALQDEAEDVVREKRAAEATLENIEASLDALAAVDSETTVLRTIGSIRVGADHDATQTTLEERATTLETRIEELQAERERLEDEFERQKEHVVHLLGGSNAGVDDEGPL